MTQTQSKPKAEAPHLTLIQRARASLASILVPKWLRHLITEQDNQTLDAKRVIALLGVAEYLYLAAHSVVVNHSPFDANSYAMGLGAILLSVGGMLGLAKGTERPVAQ